jgi:hypothetical protein
MSDQASSPSRLISTALGFMLLLLIAPAILFLSLPHALVDWAALHRRDAQRWRGFWRRAD